MKMLKLIRQDHTNMITFELSTIVSIEFKRFQFEKKTKEPAIYIKFQDGTSSTLIAANWFMMFI